MTIELFQCDICKKKMKTFHLYKTKSLCGMCYRKKFLIIPQISIEPINSRIAFSLAMTKTQKKLLDERVHYLYPKIKNCKAKYLRALIFGDIVNWKEKRGNENG